MSVCMEGKGKGSFTPIMGGGGSFSHAEGEHEKFWGSFVLTADTD